MKRLNKIFTLLLVAMSTLCIYSCSKDEILPDPTPEIPDKGLDSDSDSNEDYYNIVKNNVTVSGSYKDYTATFTITSKLKSKLPNQNIKYGIGHKGIYNDNDEINSSIGNDAYYYSERTSGDTEIITIKIPFWYYYIFVNKDESKWAECETYYNAYMELNEKGVSELASDEKSLYDTCVKELNYYEDQVKRYYKMVVEVMVNKNIINIAEYKITDMKEGSTSNEDPEDDNPPVSQDPFEAMVSKFKITPDVFTATINGSISAGEYSTYKSIDVRYGTSYGLSTYSTLKLTFSNLKCNEQLGYLFSNSEYYYRIVATDNESKTHISEIMSFTTGKNKIPTSCTYTVNNTTYKMIKVTGLGSGDFYIMQTEMSIGSNFEIDGKIVRSLDRNSDNVVIKGEFSDFLKELRMATGIEFRLPTAAEWVYAAMGGQYSKGYTYSGSNNLDLVGWYADNSGNVVHKPAQLKSNELGLYDMSGNLGEIVQKPGKDEFNVDGDVYGGYFKSTQNNCTPKSFFSQPSSGKISGTSKYEENAFDGRIQTVRLVYSAY